MVKFFQFLKTSAFRRNLIYAIIFIGILFITIYFSLSAYTKHGHTQRVPDVMDKHITEAVKILKDAGLKVKIDSTYQLDVIPGTVIDQDPYSDELVKSGRTIYITTITEEAPEVALPNMIEKTLVEANVLINNSSLRIGDTTYVPDIARDVVLDVKFAGESIKPGIKIEKGAKIDLVLGNGQGPNEVKAPNLRGLTLNEASFALQGVGLELGNVKYENAGSDTLSAVVINQTPDTSRNFISIGTQVDITLSQEPDEPEEDD
ncbi:MAG TPA: PASTA domain-containing protein [Sphingobacterium sp.]|nr:PASTA domain-containing protein [Sphingobacterium sp.]